MSDAPANAGTIQWVDLTVADAPRLRDFYRQVIGWEPSPVRMGDYDDFNMTAAATGRPAAGICHARGANAKLPAQWLIYVAVADPGASAAACVRLGGKVICQLGEGIYVLQDPAGAVMAVMKASS